MENNFTKKGYSLNVGFTYSPPCATINPKEWSVMSVLISVCGTNFCTFVSDGRKVEFDEEERIKGICAENQRKVFKLNDKLIFGVTGLYRESSNLLDPFKEYPDHSVLTMPLALKALIRYLENRKYVTSFRNYFLGGKNNKGEFCLYTIKFNEDVANFAPVLYQPNEGNFNIRISTNLNDFDGNKLIDKHLRNTMPWKNHEDLVMHMKDIIKEISITDPTVGGNIFVESIF